MRPNRETYYHQSSALARVTALIESNRSSVYYYRDRQDGVLVWIVEF